MINNNHSSNYFSGKSCALKRIKLIEPFHITFSNLMQRFLLLNLKKSVSMYLFNLPEIKQIASFFIFAISNPFFYSILPNRIT